MKDDYVYPELKEKTAAELEYTYSVGYRGKLYVTTLINLKDRGIRRISDGKNNKSGKKGYLVTESAFRKLQKQYNTCYLASL